MTPETFRSSGLRDIAMKRTTTSSIAFPERLRNRTPRTEPPLNTSHQWQPLKVQASPRLGQCCGMTPEDVRMVMAGGDELSVVCLYLTISDQLDSIKFTYDSTSSP